MVLSTRHFPRRSILPLLNRRPKINFPRKVRLGLRMQPPVVIRNLHISLVNSNIPPGQQKGENTHRISTQLGLLGHILQPLPRPRNINNPIHNHMRNMHPLGSKLPRQTLTQRPQRPFASRETRHLRITLYTCRCAREDQTRRVFRPLLHALEQQRKECLTE
jgi:hypothetical protein